MTYRVSLDLRELAHCKYCWTPMHCIYDAKKRDICYECLEEIKLENAKDIVGAK